jgi:predicted O-methyltransferase YrrM
MSTDVARGDLDQALAMLGDVEGWLSESQARRLWEAARAVDGPGQIVEIGSFRGRSTILLGLAAAEAVKVVAIDPHGGGDRGPREITADAQRGDADHRAFLANLARAGVTTGVRHVRLTSRDALDEVPGPIDMLYVDGAHRYEPARADIQEWGARVRPGGTMFVHDAYNAVGVMLAQLRLLFGSTEWRYMGRTRSLAEYRREPLSVGARIGNAVRQASGTAYFVRNCAIKISLLCGLRPIARVLGQPDGDSWPY